MGDLGLGGVFAGAEITILETTDGLKTVADSVLPELLAMMEDAAVSGILNQHGWNLGWSGIAAIIGGVFIWRGSMTAIWVAALIALLFGSTAAQVRYCSSEFSQATAGLKRNQHVCRATSGISCFTIPKVL